MLWPLSSKGEGGGEGKASVAGPLKKTFFAASLSNNNNNKEIVDDFYLTLHQNDI